MLKNIFSIILISTSMLTFVACMYVIKSKKPYFDVNIFTIYLTYIIFNGIVGILTILIKLFMDIN